MFQKLYVNQLHTDQKPAKDNNYIDVNGKMSTAQHCKHQADFGMHVTPSPNPENERNVAVVG